MGTGRFAHRVSINALGYRGGPLSLVKPVGEFRILVAGDSYTFGHNVHDEQTLPSQLADVLDRRNCREIAVVNAGLSGSTILTQRRMIERGLAVDPDLVILVFHENDLQELLDVRMWEQLELNRRLKSGFPMGVAYRVLRGSATLNLVLNVTREWRLQWGLRQPPERDVKPTESNARRDASRLEYRQHLSGIIEELGERDVPILFVLYPHPETVQSGNRTEDYSWIGSLADELGAPRLDLLDGLGASEVPISDAYLVPHDYHPSALGHLLAAGLIADALLGLELAPCPR